MSFFDSAYQFISDMWSEISDAVEELGAFLIAIVLVITFPVWVIPYKLVKINKERRSENENS